MTDLGNDNDCGCDPQLLEQRNGFMMTLPAVLKDLWPEGVEYDLTIYGKDGETVMMMGASLPKKGMWG